MIINGARLTADPLGGLWWAEPRLLVVADLHLEKGSSYAIRGQMLPPYDTANTLTRLGHLIARYDPATVLCLGDSFHDTEADERLADGDIAQIRILMRGREWLWLAGNHDPSPPVWLGGRTVSELAMAPLVFRHEPTPGTAPGEIAGHLHPKAAVTVSGRRMTRRCFAEDGQRVVLPAFGAYTGGLDVLASAFTDFFNDAFSVHLLGQGQTHRFSSRRLTPIAANSVQSKSQPGIMTT
jgi:DNA ligase-associated metallophosphoesterase